MPSRTSLVVHALLCLSLACSSESPAPSGPSAAGGSPSAAGGSSGGSGAGAAAGGSSGGAGEVSQAGSAGSAGASTTAGAGGSGGSSGGTGGGNDLDLPRPSAGCTMQPDIAPGEYVQSELEGRAVWVRLPDNYDPARAYPLVFVWKGCGGAGSLSILHLEQEAAADAILVHGDFADGMDCYDTADGAAFVDLPFFDAFLASLTGKYCVDEAHVFSAGFSSGAWLTQFLACQRAGVLRGVGTIAGGFKPSFLLDQPACAGKIAAFMISDLADTANPFFDTDQDGDSVEIAVNQWLTMNGCTDAAWSETAGTAAEPDPSVCRDYAGCGDFPVKLCLSQNEGHSEQTSISVPGFWAFFSQFLVP